MFSACRIEGGIFQGACSVVRKTRQIKINTNTTLQRIKTKWMLKSNAVGAQSNDFWGLEVLEEDFEEEAAGKGAQGRHWPEPAA